MNYAFAAIAAVFAFLAAVMDPVWSVPAVVSVCASVDFSVRAAVASTRNETRDV